MGDNMEDMEEEMMHKEDICREIAELFEMLAEKFMQLGGVDDYGSE